MQGTYAKVVPDADTKEKIAKIVDLLNLDNPACIHDLHVTVVYSRQPCLAVNELNPSLPIMASGEKFDQFDNPDGSKCLVLRLKGSRLEELHNMCRDLGAEHDYPEYNPHITLSYDYPGTIPNDSILDYFKDLCFVDFIVEPLDITWGK